MMASPRDMPVARIASLDARGGSEDHGLATRTPARCCLECYLWGRMHESRARRARATVSVVASVAALAACESSSSIASTSAKDPHSTSNPDASAGPSDSGPAVERDAHAHDDAPVSTANTIATAAERTPACREACAKMPPDTPTQCVPGGCEAYCLNYTQGVDLNCATCIASNIRWSYLACSSFECSCDGPPQPTIWDAVCETACAAAKQRAKDN